MWGNQRPKEWKAKRASKRKRKQSESVLKISKPPSRIIDESDWKLAQPPAKESRIAAAPALLEPRIAALCANVHPHMTLGMAPSVQAVESNKLLARLAAQQNFQQGLPEWLRQLKLSKYTEALSKWCHKHHVTSPEDLSALALAAAIAVEPDLRLRQIVEQILSVLESLVFHCSSLLVFWDVFHFSTKTWKHAFLILFAFL